MFPETVATVKQGPWNLCPWISYMVYNSICLFDTHSLLMVFIYPTASVDCDSSLRQTKAFNIARLTE